MEVYKAVNLESRLTSSWAFGIWESTYTPGMLTKGREDTPLFAYDTLEYALRDQREALERGYVELWKAETPVALPAPEFLYMTAEYWWTYWDTYRTQNGRIDGMATNEMQRTPDGTVLCPEGLTLIERIPV